MRRMKGLSDMNVFHVAAAFGQHVILKTLFDHQMSQKNGKKLVSNSLYSQTSDGDTPLHCAIIYGASEDNCKTNKEVIDLFGIN